MILTCPSCETQYFADDSTIGESGRTVKCAACGTSWFVGPENADGSDPSGPGAHEIYLESMRLQRRKRSRTVAFASWLVTASVFFLLGIAAITFRNDVVKMWPESAAAYKQAGFQVNRFGLEFANIARSRTFNDTIPVITVSSRILNVAHSQITAPAVRVDLKDENGQLIASHFGQITPAILGPDETGRFEIVIEPAPVESYEIELSLIDLENVPTPAPQPSAASPNPALPDTATQ